MAAAHAAERAIPPLTGPVIDEAGVLSRRQEESLGDELRAYAPTAQIQVWIVRSLEGEPIENLSIRAVDQWKLGGAKDDKGILILVAIDDRRMRIEVGQGLEGDIPDITASHIVERVIAPAFRGQLFYQGLSQAAQILFVKAGGDVSALPERYQRTQDTRSIGWLELALILLFLLVFGFARSGALGVGGRRGRSYWGGGGGWGGGGWGGGSGGGWSGGGGGFSGGGSSGDW